MAIGSCPAFIEDFCQNRVLQKRFTYATYFSFERRKKRLDTFLQHIENITKIYLFNRTGLPHFSKIKNMQDIILVNTNMNRFVLYVKI